MDRIGGREGGNELENWMGARCAASIWIYTKAVVCNGQRNMQTFRVNNMNSIMEPFDHEWVSELSLALQETKFWTL